MKFSNQATWTIGEGEELPKTRELVAANVTRVTQKWGDGPPRPAFSSRERNSPTLRSSTQIRRRANGAKGPTESCTDRAKTRTSFICST